MSAARKYLFVGDHAETLGSGRRIAPGDELTPSAIDAKDPVDQRLLDDQLLVELATNKEQKS